MKFKSLTIYKTALLPESVWNAQKILHTRDSLPFERLTGDLFISFNREFRMRPIFLHIQFGSFCFRTVKGTGRAAIWKLINILSLAAVQFGTNGSKRNSYEEQVFPVSYCLDMWVIRACYSFFRRFYVSTCCFRFPFYVRFCDIGRRPFKLLLFD